MQSNYEWCCDKSVESYCVCSFMRKQGLIVLPTDMPANVGEILIQRKDWNTTLYSPISQQRFSWFPLLPLAKTTRYENGRYVINILKSCKYNISCFLGALRPRGCFSISLRTACLEVAQQQNFNPLCIYWYNQFQDMS